MGQWIAGSLHALAFGGSFGWRRVHDDTSAQDSVRAVYVVWRSFEHSLLGRVSVFGRTYFYSSVVSYYIFYDGGLCAYGLFDDCYTQYEPI